MTDLPGEDDCPLFDTTVTLTEKSWRELGETVMITECNRTDVINRAIQIYRVVAEQVAKGHDLIFMREGAQEGLRIRSKDLIQ